MEGKLQGQAWAGYIHINIYIYIYLAHSLYKCVYCCLVAKSCSSLFVPLDCSLPGSSVYGISWTRILDWDAISFSRESSQPRDQTCASCMASRFSTTDPSEKLQVCVYIYIKPKMTPDIASVRWGHEITSSWEPVLQVSGSLLCLPFWVTWRAVKKRKKQPSPVLE